MPDAEFSRGEAHGSTQGVTGAVAAFDTYEFEVGDVVLFRFSGLRSFLPYARGEEHFDALREAIAALAAAAGPCPAWLLDDEAAAEQRAARYA